MSGSLSVRRAGTATGEWFADEPSERNGNHKTRHSGVADTSVTTSEDLVSTDRTV